MQKIIFTLLRYAFTAAGATGAVASDDALMQVASGLTALIAVIMGLIQSKRHAGKDKTIASVSDAANAPQASIEDVLDAVETIKTALSPASNPPNKAK